MSEWPQLPASLNHEILDDMSHQPDLPFRHSYLRRIGRNKSFESRWPR